MSPDSAKALLNQYGLEMAAKIILDDLLGGKPAPIVLQEDASKPNGINVGSLPEQKAVYIHFDRATNQCILPVEFARQLATMMMMHAHVVDRQKDTHLDNALKMTRDLKLVDEDKLYLATSIAAALLDAQLSAQIMPRFIITGDPKDPRLEPALVSL